MIGALGARVHVLVPPDAREPFAALFRDALRCDVRELDFGLSCPITLVSFPDGSAVSVEATDAAAGASCTTWIEFRTPDVAAVHAKLHDAGVASFRHPASPHAYFTAPGGQVFRVLDVGYQGP